MPPVPEYELAQLESLAQAVLDARAAHPSAAPADLYDPDLMPSDLRKAHHAIDRAVDHLYHRSGFSTERERIEQLFGQYEKLITPLVAQSKKTRSTRL